MMSDFSLGKLFNRLNAAQRTGLSAGAALLFYGAWGVAVNLEHGANAAVKAGCVQGSYSFLLTMCMTVLLEAVFRVNTRIFKRTQFINLITVFICCFLVFSTSWMLNVLLGTPEVLRTVILGYIVGGIYSVVYVFRLSRVNV